MDAESIYNLTMGKQTTATVLFAKSTSEEPTRPRRP